VIKPYLYVYILIVYISVTIAFVCVQLIVPLFNLYITGLPCVSLRQQLSTVALYIAYQWVYKRMFIMWH